MVVVVGGGGGGGGGDVAYLKNRDQIINLRMIGRANSEDTRILGELWACSFGKKIKFEVLRLLELH